MTQDEKQFSSEFMEMVRMSAETNVSTVESELTKAIIEYVVESGDTLAPELCECKSNPQNEKLTGQYSLAAYDYSESTGILDLFGTVFYKGDSPNLSIGAIEKKINELSCFFRLSIDGQESKRVYREKDPDVADAMDMIREEYNSRHIEQVRIFVLSNGFGNGDNGDFEDGEFSQTDASDYKIPIEYYIWDLGEVYKAEQARQNSQEYIIDLEGDYQTKLECVESYDDVNKIKSYLAIMPAILLAKIYGKYKVRVIDQNVRNFLGGKIKVNKAMAKTIAATPELFFSYNNGISSTASEVVISTDESGRKYLSKIRNWHIVNGGQTTSTIYNAYKKKDTQEKLKNAYVSVKVSEISYEASQKVPHLVGNIARYANSQTKVKESDLSANDPYMLELQRQSSKEWSTNAFGKQTLWYFERLRGQFLADKAQVGGVGTIKVKRFEDERPQSQRFNKTDVAKLEMAWMEKPFEACKGGEVCFEKYWKLIKDNTPKVDEQYFHNIVAKSIICKRVNLILSCRGNKGHASIIANYTLAILALRSQRKLDLNYIWDNQKVQDELVPVIEDCIKEVSGHLRSVGGTDGKNAQTESKKVDFWNTIQNKTLNIAIPEAVLQNETEITQVTEEQKQIIANAIKRGAELWRNLSQWCKKEGRGKMSIMEKKKIDHLVSSIERGMTIKPKLAEDCERTLRSAKDSGFDQTIDY